jgi:hypothetical protein
VLACAMVTCLSLCLRHGLWAGRWSVWECRVVLRGMSMHRRVLSVHFRKDVSLHACAIGGLFLSSSRCSVVMWRLRQGFLSSYYSGALS